ncbi:MAG: alpha/beta fold hydrolase [Silanimonas sp.]
MRGASAAAPRALFIHGAGAWGGQWAIWRRVFEAEGWAVDTPDLQPAAAGLAATRFEDYVAQAVAALESVQVDVLVGASLGGLIAMAAAGRLAARGVDAAAPRALVLVNPLPPAPWAAALPPLALEGAVMPWQSQGRFAGTRRALREAGFSDQQLAFRRWRDESAAVLREGHAGLALTVPKVATLVIASELDDEIPPPLSTDLAAGIGAGLMRVPGGHVAPVMGASAAASAQAALAWLVARLSTR